LDKDKYPLDMCLATNMVSVGVDVSRLGLMTVTGQPKSFSEYIQATSRVGRSSNAPGLVLVIYNTSKPRDKSYYEKFQSQHSKLYKSVEPTSVTPFSRPLRDRALHAIFVALHRFYADEEARSDASQYPSDTEFNEIQRIIIERASNIDPEAVEDIKEQLHKYLEEWQSWTPSKYEDNNMYTRSPEAPLMYVSGTIPLADWGDRGWKTQMAMRNVDRECQLDCSKILRAKEEE
jgi:superfamily II DNA or RNA helicase